jgi:hypothetical protein
MHKENEEINRKLLDISNQLQSLVDESRMDQDRDPDFDWDPEIIDADAIIVNLGPPENGDNSWFYGSDLGKRKHRSGNQKKSIFKKSKV